MNGRADDQADARAARADRRDGRQDARDERQDAQDERLSERGRLADERTDAAIQGIEERTAVLEALIDTIEADAVGVRARLFRPAPNRRNDLAATMGGGASRHG